MSAGAIACSSCGYENVVVGCGFCLQCGTEFPVGAAIECEPIAPEPQLAQNQSVETIARVVAPADEALVATATEANSQCVGFLDHNDPKNITLEEVNFDPIVPAGGKEAIESAVLPEQEDDSFYY